MAKKIKISVPTGHDPNHAEQTDFGVLLGKEIVQSVYLTEEEAANLIQQQVDKLSYHDAQEFYKKYKK
tara:strand:- start:1247 stop:1450 length:204 start_codon:yes stop_codon:yes gene_type:complete